MNDSLPMKIGLMAAILLLFGLVANGVSVVLGAGEYDSRADQVTWGAVFAVLPLITIAGLWLSRSQPKLGLGLVIGGAASTSLIMFWMAFVTVPLGIAVILFAIKRSGLDIWPFRTSTTGPTGTA